VIPVLIGFVIGFLAGRDYEKLRRERLRHRRNPLLGSLPR